MSPPMMHPADAAQQREPETLMSLAPGPMNRPSSADDEAATMRPMICTAFSFVARRARVPARRRVLRAGARASSCTPRRRSDAPFARS